MATSIQAQLKALKSYVKSDTEIPSKPSTKPSILYDPKEAADIDIDQIFDLACAGLEVLSNIDERFRNYKNDLFNPKSREVNRELMSDEENKGINATISSYLRLLGGHLQSSSAYKTLEFLIRRYKIHVYNIEELILCALPYHDTHVFVRIVQLIDFGGTPWKFLNGVKASGAPPPRAIIVQQCIRDMGVLEIICNYATPTKKHHPSTLVISFSTAVVVEVLGSLAIVDNDIVKRLLPFVNSGLHSSGRGCSDYKAGKLMILSLLAKRAVLSLKLVATLLRLVAELARADAQWAELSIMAFVNIVQSQSIEFFPKKVIDVLKEVRNLPGIILQLATRFNIDRFVSLLLESLIGFSSSDTDCRLVVVSIIETVTIRGLVQGVVSRLLSSCLNLSQNTDSSDLSESGRWAKQILHLLDKKYPNELRMAVHDFLGNKKLQSKSEKSVIEALCKILDGNLESTDEFSDTRIWLALEHPKADFRKAALSNLDLSVCFNGDVTSQRLLNVKDAVGRCLSDNDLSVVLAAVSLDKLSDLLDSGFLIETFKTLLGRCTHILWSSSSKNHSVAFEVAISCLKHLVSLSNNQSVALEQVAVLIFPLLLVFPKTKMLNLKARELATAIKWPYYRDLVLGLDMKMDLEKKAGKELFPAVNMSLVRNLAKIVSTDGEKFMHWLIKCCGESELAKTLTFMVLMESFVMETNAHQLLKFQKGLFAFLKAEWRSLEHTKDFSCGQEFTSKVLDEDDLYLLDEFDENNIKSVNAKMLIFVFWRIIKAYNSIIPADANVDDDGGCVSYLRDLYVFFAESNLKHLFKEHRHYLVKKGKFSSISFLSTFISVEGISSHVQIESLHSLAMLCSEADEGLSLQLLAGFPVTLVPLSSDVEDVRRAAMSYVEELCSLSSRVKSASKKNGSSDSWGFFLDKFLSLLVEQKKLILSDRDFLPALLASILSASFRSLLVPQDIGQRFEKSTSEGILTFILGSAMKFPGYAKLKILFLLKELGGAIVRVKDVHSLLCELLQRRRSSYQELSKIDVDVLCLLIEICSMPTALDIGTLEDHLLPALWIDDMVLSDAALVRPYVTFLENLNENLYSSLSAEMKLNLFQHLVLLYHDANIDVQNSTREALLRLDISYSTVSRILDSIPVSEINTARFSDRKRKKSKKQEPDVLFAGKNVLQSVSSLLDVLLLKKDMSKRALLLEPLFGLLKSVFSDHWVTQTPRASLCYIHQTLLLILEDIISSLPVDGSVSNKIFDKFDAGLLVNCARSATDFTTCNHVYLLFAAVSKVATDKVLHQVPDILTVLGKSTVGHDDSHSRRVFEDFISTVVPCWLSKMDGAENLLKIFVNVMPDIAQHRRLSIVLHLLKTLGESRSLGSLLLLLFRSLASKVSMSSFDYETQWEFKFAEHICEQYTSMIWLPSLVSMLIQLQAVPQDNELFLILLSGLKFIMGKLQDPEFVFKLQSLEDMDIIQGTLGELMVQVVFCWQLVDSSKKKISLSFALKKDLKELAHSVVIKITKGMLPSTFFRGIINLLVQADKTAKKKALQVLCETVRDFGAMKSKRRDPHTRLLNSWNNLAGSDLESFSALCLEILQLFDGSDQNVTVRLAAFSALEVLANKFPSHHTIFSKCLTCVVRNISLDDLVIVASSLRTSGTLISVLGPRALPELPQIMKSLMQITRDASPSSVVDKSNHEVATSNDPLMLSILVTLEALVNNLGSFLSPYLGDIIDLLVLHPDCVSESNPKLKSKADGLRKLISEKVPVRLVLPAMENVYPKAVKSGDLSLTAVFELLKNFVSNMDKASVSGYHTNIFDFCMLALDLRSQRLASLENINGVENYVINAMISLSMKMTESMFKPLFIKGIEWVESKMGEDDRSISRAVSFYGLVNKLAENHRSLFVPYFKYLLDGSVKYLTGDDSKSDQPRKKKKAKLQTSEEGKIITNKALTLEHWHLRALVLSSLHKCFLYDTRYDSGSLKFMDSSKFHQLLKPIVSQLIVRPPASLKNQPNVPSIEEVDDVLVSCLGQLAIAAGSDLLWKSLNHEVLMQTRSEMVRPRLLGLKITKYLVENLKEEFLALLAETIPFLAELLEDVELPVKTLAQEILKELETMSGENLRQYF
ncbi:uncharacterized protein At3g06530-like [Silene latifolia]|uniref:uncharacterized protein At3g06530-like n=1 Tax=Silene latifolia TaxID=37657 RepID=UPI003D771547